MICLRMGKTTETKPHQVILRSPLPRIHYYQSQAVTRIRNVTKPFDLSRNTNLQLNPYPNTQLDLNCSSNLFCSMHKSQYVTNQWCMNSSTWLTYQLEEVVGCKVLQFINNEYQEAPWSQNPWRKDAVVSSERIMNLGTFYMCNGL